MFKKIIITTLFSIGIANTPLIKADERNDKYAEWCQNLDLNEEQAQKLSSYLDECKAIFNKEKLKEYQQAIQENKTPQEKFEEDTEAKIFALKTQQIIEDPVLLKTIVQVFFLAGLEMSYLIPNKDLVNAFSENASNQQKDLESAALIFQKMEESIDACKACKKLHKR